MRRFVRESFASLAVALVAALVGGALFAEMAQSAMVQKKAAAATAVIVTNSRTVALTELDATPSDGYLPKKIVGALAPGKKLSAPFATDKDCVFDLHGIYADGSVTDSKSVDLCKDKTVNLVD
jgi:hypothetical protein